MYFMGRGSHARRAPQLGVSTGLRAVHSGRHRRPLYAHPQTSPEEGGSGGEKPYPTQTTLFSNNPLIFWYSGRGSYELPVRYAWDLVLEPAPSRRLLQYDYLAVRVKRTQKEQGSSLIATVGRPSAAVFANTKGDKVLVFQLH